MLVRLLAVFLLLQVAFGLRGLDTTHPGAHFHYDDCEEEPAGCPDNWGELAIDKNQCGSTLRQSPIDLPRASDVEGVSHFDIAPHYAPFEQLNLVNNGHTIQVDTPAGVKNGLTVTWDNGVKAEYKLLQFHFHTKSEHSVDGRRFPLEVHLVHQIVNPVDGAESHLVLGAFFTSGDKNLFLESFIDRLPEIPVDGKNIFQSDSIHIDLNQLLSIVHTSRFWTYKGSLTTPPCSEIVHWVVLNEPAGTVSRSQLKKIAKKIPGGVNARPVQPLGDVQEVLIHQVNVVHA
eukprot:TRINITY_DN713_c0_g1_i2.p2 TRINITY_DN713_c0_g1~~TRINITY_DN713_c0_g1_i2.p2  ORF type:complete len:288 (-),score=117.66 TRINITY_DN713_c0_g1_i2:82-945(-)